MTLYNIRMTNLEEKPFEWFHKLGEQLKTKKRSLDLEHVSLMKRRKKLYSEWVKKDKIFGAEEDSLVVSKRLTDSFIVQYESSLIKIKNNITVNKNISPKHIYFAISENYFDRSVSFVFDKSSYIYKDFENFIFNLKELIEKKLLTGDFILVVSDRLNQKLIHEIECIIKNKKNTLDTHKIKLDHTNHTLMQCNSALKLKQTYIGGGGS